ncbi:MAG: Ig-like domain-containing protein [Spirochaetes bacterium]|nr:Ig-like domain-containing protein [Spirochaetota bacterium]
MKMNRLNTILISLTVALIFIVGITCQNSLVQSGNSNDATPTTTIDTTKRGSLRIYIEENIKTRTIITDASAIAFDQYSIELTSDDGFEDRTADFISNVAVFNAIEAGSWNIAVKAKQAGLVLATGALYNKTITADTTTDLTIDIKLNQSATGNVKIRISFPDDSEVDYVEAQLFGDTDYTALSIIDNSPDVDHKMVVFERNNVTSGMIDLLLTFKKGGASGTILGMYREAVNIFDNLTSDKWIDGTTLKSVLLYSATDFASTNANLLNLKTSYGSLGFSSTTYGYSLSVPNSVSNFSVKPTEGIIGQSIFAKFNGGLASIVKNDTSSDTFALNVGDNTIDVEVTAQDYATKKNYIITINRAPIPATPVLLDGIFDITSDALYGVDKTLALTSANSTQIRYIMTSAVGTNPANPADPTLSDVLYSAPINLTSNEGETTIYKIKAVGFNDFGEAGAIGGVWTVTIDKEAPDTPTIGMIVSGGKYSSDQKFTLISANADKIYYTIISRIGSIPADPADPSADSGILYNNSPVDLTADTGQTKYYKIKAIAYDVLNNASPIGGVWTVTIDIQSPYVISYSPTPNATGVSPTANLVLTFDETVDIGTGNIYIKTYSTDTTYNTINVSSVVISGNQVTIDPTIPLLELTQYYVTIDPTAFKDSVGNLYAGISSKDTWKFSTGDTTAPYITNITSTPVSGSFSTGEIIFIDVTFNEIVNVLLGTPTLSLNSGGTASLSGGSTTTKLTFKYIVGAGDNTADLDVTSLNLGAATIKDASLNDANLTLPGSPNRLMDNSAIVIDTTAPSAPIVSGITSGRYNIAQTFTISGESGAAIEYSLNNGSTWILYSGEVTIPDTPDSTNDIISKQTDSAGNISANSALITVIIDKTAPQITNITSSNTSGTYYTDQTIDISVQFSESVTIIGTPNLSLNSGGTAYYLSVIGNTLTFKYIVGVGDNTADLDVTTFNLNGATMKDAAGNNAVLTLPSSLVPGSANLAVNKNIEIDGTTPRNVQLTITLITPTYFEVTTDASAIEINKNIGESLFVNASIQDGGGINWKWYLDGTSVQNGLISNLAVNSLDYSLGIHNLAVVVTKDGRNYSAQITFKVVSR